MAQKHIRQGFVPYSGEGLTTDLAKRAYGRMFSGLLTRRFNIALENISVALDSLEMKGYDGTMNTTIDSYFSTVHQIAAEREATYSHGTTWAAVDSTRDGERVVVEVSFYDGEDAPYYVGEVYEYIIPTALEPDHVDSLLGTDSAELYRKMGQWV